MKLWIKFLLLLLLSSCTKLNHNEKANYAEYLSCGNNEDDNIYQLNENYFSKDSFITLKLKVVYFTNGISKPLSVQFLKNRIELSNSFFLEAKIKFKFVGVVYVKDRPEQDSSAITAIQAMETLNKESRKDLREKYYIEHYEFWNSVYAEKGVITAYIYDNVDTGYTGVAGGIGSTYFAISAPFTSPEFHTWEHELGHDLGLYHTHQYDPTDGLNNVYGDMICDTYKSIDTLSNVLDDSCRLRGTCPIPNEYLETLVTNIMSYTKFKCRANFTPVQNLRKRKTIETSADLRSTIDGFDKLMSKTWKNLEKVGY